MESLSNHKTAGVTENADHFVAGLKPHLLYKSLLIQRAQKLKKPAPLYQTQKEGSEHLPMFRSTVWVDGVSYTSSNTFRQRKNAEMDVSRVAYIAITQKEKTDALDFIREDKIFCKSVMAEYAAKKNIGKPAYKTTQLVASLPVFRSNLVFNGDSYLGDSANSKKEAGQLVARSAIIRYLASESGTDMMDVVNSKFRQYQEINSVQIGSNAHALQPMNPQLPVEQTAPTVSVAVQQPTEQVSTKPVNQVVPLVIQPPTPHVSTDIKPVADEPVVLTSVPSAATHNSTTADVKAEPDQAMEQISPVDQASYVSTDQMHPVVTQQPVSQVSVETIKPVVVEPLVLTWVPSSVVYNSAATHVTKQLKTEPDQQLISQVSGDSFKSVVAKSRVLTAAPSTVDNNSVTVVAEPLVLTSVPSVVAYNSAATHVMKQLKTEPDQQHISQVSREPIKPVVAKSRVLTAVPSIVVNNSVTANVMKQPKAEPGQQPISQISVEPIKTVNEPLVLNPVPSALINNSATANVIKQPKAEPDQAMVFIPVVDQASDKKRSSTSKRDGQKKMCGSVQMPPMIPATSQVLPFTSQ